MKLIRNVLRSPYTYIFLATYAAVWVVWEYLKLPFSNPGEVVSYLPSIGYNPVNNMLRFAAAVLLPPLACLGYWWLSKRQKSIMRAWDKPKTHRVVSGVVITFCLLLTFGMGVLQGTTNPDNNLSDHYNQKYQYFLTDTFHEGETLGPAVSYDDPSKKPYRDFVIVHGVFQDPVRTTLAFDIFGKSIGAARTMAAILGILAFSCFFLLILLLFRGDVLRATIALLAFAALILPAATVPFWRDYFMGVQLPFRDMATMAFIAAAVLAFRFALAKRTRWVAGLSAVIGFIVMAGFANSIDRAIYITLLAIAWLIMMAAILGRAQYLRQVAGWCTGGVVVGFVVLWVALKGDFTDFLRYIVDISKHKELLDGMPFAQPGPEVTVVLLTIAATLLLSGFWLAQRLQKPLAKQRTWQLKAKAGWVVLKEVIREHHTLILLGLTALVFMRSALGRSLIDHFMYVVQWLYLFVIYFVLAYAFPLKKRFSFTASFFILAALGGMLLLYAGIVKTTDLSAHTFPLNVKDEQLIRKDYWDTAQYLKQNLTGDETFMTLTSEGIWYYLVDKPSPVQYPIIWYAFTKAERTELAHDVEANKNIKYLVTNHHWTTNFDYVPNELRFPELYDVVRQLYEPYKGYGDQTIWIRK